METYAGELTFEGKQRRFSITNKMLRIYAPDYRKEPEEYKQYVDLTLGSTFITQERHLIGMCHISGKRIVVVLSDNNFAISYSGDFLFTPVRGIIKFHGDIELVSKIHFYCDELNCIYDTQLCIGEKTKWNRDTPGSLEFHIKPYSETNICDGNIVLNGISVSVSLLLARWELSNRDKDPEGYEYPIRLRSILSLQFDATMDYDFVEKLISHTQQLLSFLCYRKNIVFDPIELKDSGSHSIAHYIDFQNIKEEVVELEARKKHFIPYNFIYGKLHKIFQHIVDYELPLFHIPESYSLSKHTGVDDYILTTAAFEYEFNRKAYPYQSIVSKSRLKARENVKSALYELHNSASGKEKEEYKRLIGEIDNVILERKIEYALNEFSNILEPYNKVRYEKQGIRYLTDHVARFVSQNRNIIGHGNLIKAKEKFTIEDTEAHEHERLGIKVIKHLIYVMQLSHYDVPDEDILKILQHLYD